MEVVGRIIWAMGTTAKSSARRSYLWIIPLCVIPGLVAPVLRGVVWYYHLGALELALATGAASVAGFAAVATWAALRLQTGRRAGQSLEGGAQTYWALLGVCAISAVLLTVKLAPFAFRVLAP
ncbi:MAG TPA: hypothetical protein VKQ54_13830 [Caulobacteraceae bacterium]|nr:hypothetical protein [Caulobacteraceae bacterium]